jgi:hypothetical protein
MAYGMMSEEERKRALMAQMLQQRIMEQEPNTTNRGLNRPPTQNEVLGLPDTDYSMNASMVGPGVMTGTDMQRIQTGLGPGIMTETDERKIQAGLGVTPQEIDEEIRRLQIMKNQMMIGN